VSSISPRPLRGLRVLGLSVALGVAGLGGLAGFGPAASPASAASNLETGVWWSVQQAGNPVPLPPSVPDGGLWVEQRPDGQSAVSALRFGVSATEIPQSITLVLHQPIDPAGSAVRACASSSDWAPVRGGPIADAPKQDCSTFAAIGQTAADGKSIRFDLSGFAPVGTASLILVPGNPAVPVVGALPSDSFVASPTSTTYDITFEKPTLDGLESVGGGGTGAADDLGATSSTYDAGAVGSGGYGGAGSSSGTDNSDSFGSFGSTTFDPGGTAFDSTAGGAATGANGSGAAGTPGRSNGGTFVPAVSTKVARDSARIAAGLAFFGLFLFGGLNRPAVVNAARAAAGAGKVSIYDWPPAPTQLPRATTTPPTATKPPALR